MPFWDPYFGWDFHAMGQTALMVTVFGLFLGLFGATEHGDSLYLYRQVWEWVQGHEAPVLGTLIIAFVAGFYYWRMQGGDF